MKSTVATLSPSGRRALELVCLLASKPAVVLLDEPAAGADARGVGSMIALARAIADTGAAVVVVEHQDAVLQVADEVLSLLPMVAAIGAIA